MQNTSEYETILAEAAAYAEHFINDKVGENYVFHNFQHTMAVVEAAELIAEQYELDAEERFIVTVAAWFHDTGYAQAWQGHEKRGAEIAKEFLQAHEVDDNTTQQIMDCILATTMPQKPQNLLEQIVCDADLSHLGQSSYWDRCGRVRQEFTLTRDTLMSDQEWVDFELGFMLSHQYHTEIARGLFDEAKARHIKQLYKRKRGLYPDQTPKTLAGFSQENLGNKKAKKRAKKEARALAVEKDIKLGRGVETMYRATYRTHVNLSSIADNKANIMLSVNAIILSITAANLFPKLDSSPQFIVPTVLLVAVCLGSLFFAIQATRPKVTEGKVTRDDIEQRRSNLLFFGNFYNMKLEDFHYGMQEMIRDEDFLYSSMTRDLYYLGVVLAKKYKFLRNCYNVFLYGLIVAVASFVVAAMW